MRRRALFCVAVVLFVTIHILLDRGALLIGLDLELDRPMMAYMNMNGMGAGVPNNSPIANYMRNQNPYSGMNLSSSDLIHSNVAYSNGKCGL